MRVALTTSVSVTIWVTIVVAVTDAVDTGAVLTPSVTVGVVASMPKQLHATESLEAGWLTSLLLARVGQLAVDVETAVRFWSSYEDEKNEVVVEVVVEVTVTVA